MSLTLTQNFTAVAPSITSYFRAVGGTSPYTYSVMPGGAGGTIGPTSGLYTAPEAVSEDPGKAYDFVQVVDNAGTVATARILVGTALSLFCDIIQTQMGLADGRVYLWDQKIMQPTDYGLYIAVSVPRCKPFGNNIQFEDSDDTLMGRQTVNMSAQVDVDLISRGPAARDQKEFIVAAVNSVYSEQQQEANSFYISRLPIGGNFINLSEIDGAAIPYRYKVSFAMQYSVTRVLPVPYYNVFQSPGVVTNS